MSSIPGKDSLRDRLMPFSKSVVAVLGLKLGNKLFIFVQMHLYAGTVRRDDRTQAIGTV